MPAPTLPRSRRCSPAPARRWQDCSDDLPLQSGSPFTGCEASQLRPLGADASSDPLEGITEDYRQRALTSHPISINWGQKFAERFTVDEAAALHRRFAILDDKLQAEQEHFAPGFQARPMRYFFNQMPVDFTLKDFIGSWN